MRLIQFTDADGTRLVGVVAEDGRSAHALDGVDSVYALARAAIDESAGIAELGRARWRPARPTTTTPSWPMAGCWRRSTIPILRIC